ncbi:hypothetical protein [Chryseobacterium sp. MFBS3-17]|uniref:hypothetical protein n=1 Tax=Chryseobacterium sp. MFBS3-17 TaxID=2886689 RepID=UPI001D0E30A1|nr:hypothetical protein [Chryseobacterium sp. MFBS3-17]MCC2590332.1 hypothetical protein [Chryseobacterium sp. MFBS3-17]
MPLHNRDVRKLLKAGFIIIREDLQNLVIKCKTVTQRDWHTMEKGFASKAAMRRRMDEMLKDSKIIED